MQPQQPYPGTPVPPKPEQTPYDFFLANQQHGAKPVKSPFMLVVIGAVVIIVIIIIAALLLSTGNGGNKQQILSVVRKQQEIVRVAELGTKGAQSTEAANLAVTTKLSVTTSQQQLIAAVKSKFSEKDLDFAKDANVDTQLEQATQASRFDETFIKIMKQELADYETALQAAYQVTTSDNIKTILDSSYKQVLLLENKDK
jgi:hypothetical protein